MALRGETIGAAYIRILADGSGFSDDARREVRQHESTFRELGDRSNKAWQEGWDKEEKKHAKTTLDDLEHELQKGLGKFDNIGAFLGSDLMTGLENRLREIHGEDIGSAIARDLRQGLESGDFGLEGIAARLRNIRPEIAKATRAITADQALQFKELSTAIEDYGRGINRNRAARQGLVTDFTNLVNHMSPAVRASRDFRDRVGELSGILRGGRTDAEKFGSGLEGLGKKLEGVAGGIGKVFGKGSRNNLLNFFGGFVSLIPTLVASLVTWLSGASAAAQKFGSAFQDSMLEAGGGVFGLISAVVEFGLTAAPSLVAGVVAIAASIGILVSTLGIAAAAISLLAGAVLILAGSLAFALVGAAAAVGGALVPLGIGIATFVIALASLAKKTGELAKNKDFQQLTKDWRDLQSVLAKDIFGKNLQRLSGLDAPLKLITPLLETAAKAMGHLVDAFEKWSKTPQAKTLFKGISDAIGPMIQSLGDIGGNVLLAIGQGFLDAKPYINQFLGWLKTVTKSWDDFTKRDPKGKSKFGDFLKSATDSLKAVWGVIKQIGTIIGQVFTVNAKTGAGNDLFKGISDSLTGVSNWLKDPKNQKSLEGWIKDAETLAQKLGDVVVAFTVMLTQLDTPRNRGWLFDVLDVVKNIFIWIGTTSVAVDDLATKLEGVIAQWQAAKQQEQIAHPPPTTEAGRIFEGGPITAIADLWKAFKTWSATNPIHMWVTGSGSGSLPGDLDAAGKAISTWASGLGGPDSGIGTLIGKLRQPFTDFYNWLASQPGLGVIIAGWVTQAQLGFTVLGPMLQQPFIDFYNWLASQPGLGVVMAGWITQLQSAFTGFGLWLDAFGASLILSIGNWFTNNQFLQGVLLAVNAIKQPFIDLYNFLIGHSLIPDLVNGIVDWFSRLPGMILGALGNLGSIFASWVASLPGQAATVAGQIRGAFVGLAGRIITAAGSIAGAIGTWFASLPGKASSIATQVRNAFNGLAGRIIGAAGSIAGAISGWFSSLPGRARSIASQIVNAFSGLAHRAISAAGSLASAIAAWTSGAYGRAKSAGDSIAQGLRDALSGVLGTINVGSLNIPASARKLLTASGGVFFGAQTRIIGEAGPEAVVPLNRPLSMVDPSVRALSAFAQGKSVDITATGRGGKTIEVGAITIITPTEDPRAVAAEVVARMAAASYI